MQNSFQRLVAAIYRSSGRVFLANLLSGCLIAFSVYLFCMTSLPDLVIERCIRILFLFGIALADYRRLQFPPGSIIVVYLAAAAFSAWSCTYIRSIGLMVAMNTALAGLLLYSGWHGLFPFIPLLGISVVIFLITAAALIDNLLQGRSLRRAYQQAAEKQLGESAILRHITHSVTPTVQTVLSPLNAVVDRFRGDATLDMVISRRRDGSEERMSEALETAIVGLEQIRDIIATTEDIFGNMVEERDFEELDIREIFRQEIMPLYTGSRFEIRTEFNNVTTMRLHRPSFIQAIKNLIRNAEVHGFSSGFNSEEPPYVSFRFSRTVREIVMDCGNNGLPLPEGFVDRDFLAFGRKGKESPGKGLGGAWVAKFVELHTGTFTIMGRNPVHFRITLPRKRF